MGFALVQYGRWHYGRGISEFFKTAKNFLAFLLHFFSIFLLLKTLFHPWRRMKENYAGGLDLGALASSLIVNMIMRIVGIVSRLVIIALGIFTLGAAFVGALISLVLWLLAPFLGLLCIIAGISLIIKAL